MILGADFFRFLFSADGVIVFLLIAAVWIRATHSRAARRFLYAIAIFYGLCSPLVVPTTVGKILVHGLRPFRASDVPAGTRTAIVVLGTGSVTVGDWWGENYSVVDRTAAQRVLEAAHVYRDIHSPYVISSGGEPHPSTRREPGAITMRKALIELGVPADRILIETTSKTTRDEAVIVAGMMKSLPVDRIVLVTSESHMPRSLGTFRAVGLDCIPAVAAEYDYGQNWVRELLPSRDGLEESGGLVHELLGLAYYVLRGWWVR